MDDRIARGGAPVLVLLLASAGLARADPPPTTPTSADDARALFGLQQTPAAPPLDCGAPGPFGCVFATDPLAPFAPAAVGARLDARWLESLPSSDATHDRAAGLAPGVARDPFGISVPGASGIEDRWTIDGAPVDDPRSGGAGTRVPLAFLRTIVVTTGGFAARDRASTGALIDAELARGGDRREIRGAAWLTLGTPARVASDPRYAVITGAVGAQRAATVAVTAGGPAPLGGAWYFAGVQARLQPFTYTGTARRETDRDGDGVPDRDAGGDLALETIATSSEGGLAFDVPFVARAGYARGPHELALTLIGDYAGDTRFDPVATLAAGATDLRRLTADAIATYRGRWAHTRATVQWAWHRDADRERAHDPAAADLVQENTAFVPPILDEDPALAAACDDAAAADPYKRIVDCPVETGYFARGGAGLLTDATADRPSVTASVAHTLGEHTLELGVTGEDARLVIDRRYTGGALDRSLFGADRIESRFVALGGGPDTCAGQACTILDHASTTVRARSAAAWLEETWRPDPRVAADVGARWDYLQLGGADGMHALLPRAGLAWDPLGGGRSRVFTGFARTTPVLPLRVAETIAGGPARLDVITFPGGTSAVLHDPAGTAIATGTAPVIVDDVTAGAEVAVASAVRLGVALEWRTLRRGLDSDGTLITSVPAHRDAGTFTLQLATAPTSRVALRLAYTYARALGDWAGPADPSLGPTTYAGAEWSGTPVIGDLPTDLRHRLVAEVVVRRKVGAYELIAGGRAVAASGRPLGAAGADGALILARGSLGRTPPATAADLHVALRRGAWEAGVDLINVFDHRPPVLVDERYTIDAARPISGGAPSDLVFLRADDGAVAARNPDFGRPTAFLAPLTATLYARAAF